MANKSKKTLVGITETDFSFSIKNSERYTRMVYFERFKDKRKALRRKRLFMEFNKKQMQSLITKKNPEWLNLIFTFCNDENILEVSK
ncbi:MAG: hypothetical protein M3R36_13875 [Bacteroidota bacterium]|nr:hypothetical protein [Bacteroidota bacterium]